MEATGRGGEGREAARGYALGLEAQLWAWLGRVLSLVEFSRWIQSDVTPGTWVLLSTPDHGGSHSQRLLSAVALYTPTPSRSPQGRCSHGTPWEKGPVRERDPGA